MIPGCIGPGVRLGSGSSSGGAAGGVWKSGNLGTWKSGNLESQEMQIRGSLSILCSVTVTLVTEGLAAQRSGGRPLASGQLVFSDQLALGSAHRSSFLPIPRLEVACCFLRDPNKYGSPVNLAVV